MSVRESETLKREAQALTRKAEDCARRADLALAQAGQRQVAGDDAEAWRLTLDARQLAADGHKYIDESRELGRAARTLAHTENLAAERRMVMRVCVGAVVAAALVLAGMVWL